MYIVDYLKHGNTIPMAAKTKSSRKQKQQTHDDITSILENVY